MTTIVFDGQSVAIDRCVTCDGLRQEAQKWRRTDDGRIVFIAGNVWLGEFLFNRFNTGKLTQSDWPAHQRKDDETALLIILDQARGELYELGTEPVLLRITEPYCWGSGAHLARGALSMGAVARDAVLIAGKHDRNSGFGADVFSLRVG